MTAFADILAAVVAALASANVAGGRVYRAQAWPLPENFASMVFVTPRSSRSELQGIARGPVDWTTDIDVEIRARFTPDSQPADAPLDAIIGATYQVLAAFTAPGVQDVIPGSSIVWDFGDSDVNVVAATLSLTVVHRTESATLSAWT